MLGPKACSYADKFKDGKHIKLINNISLNQNTYKDDLISEKNFINYHHYFLFQFQFLKIY